MKLSTNDLKEGVKFVPTMLNTWCSATERQLKAAGLDITKVECPLHRGFEGGVFEIVGITKEFPSIVSKGPDGVLYGFSANTTDNTYVSVDDEEDLYVESETAVGQAFNKKGTLTVVNKVRKKKLLLL